jgi:DNA-directed RNA polymerase subunit RPC12/RpoP
MTGYPYEFVPLDVECGRCGTGLEVAPDPEDRALIGCDEEILCPYCGTTNQMGVDADTDDEIGIAYVSHWTCGHGIAEEDRCWRCAVQDWWYTWPVRRWLRVMR